MSMFEPKTGELWAEARNIDTTNYRILRWFVVTAVDGDTVTTADVDQERWSQDRPDKSSWRLDPPVDVRPGPFKTISRDNLRNKNFVLMADAAQVGAILPTREEITVATTVKAAPAGQGDLMAQLGVLASLVADATTKKPVPAPKPPRQRTPATKKPARPTPVEIPADKMVTPDMLASLGVGTLFRVGGSSIVTFDHLEDGGQPGTVTVWTSSGWSFRHGVDERRMRVYTPAEAEFERRLSNLEHPGMQRNPLGTVPAGQVADGTFVQATGMLPTGEQATLVGYVVSVMTVVRNYQGWTKNDCCAVTIAERPEHLDGVQIEMSPDGELTVLDTGVPVPGQPLPAGTSAPWTKPTAEQLLADAGLKLTGDAEDGPGTVTWRMPWMGPERTEPAGGAVQTKLLSNGGGPVGNWRWILNQTMVDKAIADGVWPHPLESGPQPLHRVRDGATGSLTGLVDGREETVYGEYRYFWTSSSGASCSPTVYVPMKVVTGPDVMDWKMVTVEVPWTGATFHLGDATPADGGPVTEPVLASDEPPADLFALLNLASMVADKAEAVESAAAGPKVLALADVPWGTYGTVSAAWSPDGSVAKQRTGYITKTARVCTAGMMGHAKTLRKGEPLLSYDLEIRANGSSTGGYAKMDATFTISDPPDDHLLHATMRLSRRLPFADVRPGDVIYLWDEREGNRTLAGFNIADLRTRYHVQGVPRQAGNALCQVQVLVDGEGPIVEMSRPHDLWVDIVDPRDEPWHDAATGELVNPMVRGRRELADRLGPNAIVLVDPDGIVVVSGVDVDEAAVAQVFDCPYRWWLADGDRQIFQPAYVEPHGPVGGRVGTAADGYDEARQVLAEATVEHYGFCLPSEDLDKQVWEKVHAVLRGMGTTGGSRKGQSYDFKLSRMPELRVFIAGGPAPRHERVTVGWVRTPDNLALDVVTRFAELERVPRHDGGCQCCERPRVLEPSAGDGSLVAAVLAVAPDADLCTVEVDPERAATLRAMGGFPVHECPFEEFADRFSSPSLKGYDLVVMNPPYSTPGTPVLWASHVKLAWGLLAAGGRLVAILPGRPAEPDSRIQAVLDMVGPDAQWEQLPARSFRQTGKGGTNIDTWVLAATKPADSVEAARRTYWSSIYRPAEGEPVKVSELALSRKAAQETPVQASRDWGGDFVARYVGRCVVCTVSCWGRDDGQNDPRGVLGLNAVAALCADERTSDMEGPDVCLCWGCHDSGIMDERGVGRARAMWIFKTQEQEISARLADILG